MIASGSVPHAERRRLAAKAFQHVALYDTAISTYLRQDGQIDVGDAGRTDRRLVVDGNPALW